MNEDYVFIQTVLRAAITDAYRLGIGAAIETLLRYRGSTLDVETFDRAIEELRRQSAGAEKKP
jgi:hypothetical protein